MKLSTRGRYGTRLLLDVALHESEGRVPLRDVAQRQDIPLAYAKRLIAALVTGGLLRSIRGIGGGVSLARPPHLIKLREIIELLEGRIALVECITNPRSCKRSHLCVTRDIWSELDKATNGILDLTTLRDLVERHTTKTQATGAMYYI